MRAVLESHRSSSWPTSPVEAARPTRRPGRPWIVTRRRKAGQRVVVVLDLHASGPCTLLRVELADGSGASPRQFPANGEVPTDAGCSIEWTAVGCADAPRTRFTWIDACGQATTLPPLDGIVLAPPSAVQVRLVADGPLHRLAAAASAFGAGLRRRGTR